MPDVFTKEKRSEVMSLIKGKGNKRTEGALIKIFKEYGITGWRRHLKLPGKPDFTFRKERLTVFVDRQGADAFHGFTAHATTVQMIGVETMAHQIALHAQVVGQAQASATTHQL